MHALWLNHMPICNESHQPFVFQRDLMFPLIISNWIYIIEKLEREMK
jgi:hypothetical protein